MDSAFVRNRPLRPWTPFTYFFFTAFFFAGAFLVTFFFATFFAMTLFTPFPVQAAPWKRKRLPDGHPRAHPSDPCGEIYA